MVRLLGSIVLALGLFTAGPAPAQTRVAQADVERTVDGVLERLRAAGASSARRGAVSASASGDVTIEAIEAVSPGPRPLTLGIRRVRLEDFMITGPRWSARRIVADDVSVTGEGVVARIPTVALSDVEAPSLADAVDVLALLRAVLTTGTLDRLEIASGTFDGDRDGGRGSATLPSITGERLAGARLATLAIGPARLDVSPPGGGRVTVSVGEGRVTGTDFGVLFDVLDPPATADRTTRRTLYAAGSVAGIEAEARDPRSGTARLRLGAMTIEGVEARAPRTGLIAYLQAVAALPPPAVAAPDRIADVMRMGVDLGEAVLTRRTTIESGSIEADGTRIAIGRIEARETTGVSFAAIEMRAMTLNAASGLAVRLDRFALTGFDIAAFLTAAAADPAQTDPIAQYRDALPRLSGLEIEGLDSRGAPDETFSLDRLSFELGPWSAFVPERLAVRVERFVMPLAALESAMNRPRPSDLGYTELPIDAGAAWRYLPGERRASLEAARIGLRGMGSIALDAWVGAIDPRLPRLEGGDLDERLLGAVTAERVRLRIENAGLFERVLAWRERVERTPAAAQRQQMTMMARALIEASLPEPETRRAVADAVAAFIANPRSITFTFTPTRPPLTLADLRLALTVGVPAVILRAIRVEVRVND